MKCIWPSGNKCDARVVVRVRDTFAVTNEPWSGDYCRQHIHEFLDNRISNADGIDESPFSLEILVDVEDI